MKSNLPLPHGLLTPGQKVVLKVFSELPDQEQFYLTGGTALAEFYLGHRLSYDLDLFTGLDGLVQPVSYKLEEIAGEHQLGIQVVRRFVTYAEFLITYQDEQIKVDLALDSPFRFQPAIRFDLGFWVNNFSDLCVDKLLAYYGRAEPRDAVDLYFILQLTGAGTLLEQARQKDPGFDLYWFSVALNRCLDFPDEPERWPVKMLADWNPQKIKSHFNSWSIELMESLRK